jgi:hypothetical protein
MGGGWAPAFAIGRVPRGVRAANDRTGRAHTDGLTQKS